MANAVNVKLKKICWGVGQVDCCTIIFCEH